jgi:tetratricopeptide (TPR) repeat protein
MPFATKSSLVACIAVTVGLALAGSAAQAQAPSSPQVTWVSSIAVAQTRASNERKLLFVYFRGSSVPECLQMERFSFVNRAVVKMSKEMVMAKLDVEQSEAAQDFARTRKVDIQRLPAILVLDKDGGELHRVQQGRGVNYQGIYTILRACLLWWKSKQKADANPSDPVLLKRVGQLRLNLSSRAQAQDPLEKVLKLDPQGKRARLDQVYLWLAQVHAGKDTVPDTQRAHEYAGKAMAANLENAGGITGACYLLLGQRAIVDKEYDKANGFFQKMIDVDPDDFRGQASVGMYRQALLADLQGKLDETITIVDRLVDRWPFSRMSYPAMSLKARTLYQRKGDKQGAIDALTEIVNLWPGSAQARQAAADIAELKRRAATQPSSETPSTTP